MTTRDVTGAPSLLLLYAKIAATAIPGSSRLPLLGSRGDDMPVLTMRRTNVALARNRLGAYSRLCGFPLSDTLPPTYPHVLAFPLQLAIMTERDFPFSPLGLVNTANEVVQHRPIDVAEILDIEVRSMPLRPHPRGLSFSLRTTVHADRDLVWEETWTGLRRCSEKARRRGDRRGDSAIVELPDVNDLSPSAVWRLSDDLGRRYAALSGDINPIHIHSLSARLFGFPSAIAHGMWTNARCLAALRTELPNSFRASVAFRKPIVLPASVVFAESAYADGIHFGVRSLRGDVRHLEGAISFGT